MCTYFNTKTDVAQNMVHDFFLTFTVRGPFHRKDFKGKKIWGYGVTELNETVEAATGSYSVTGNSLQYIYSVPVTKNH